MIDKSSLVLAQKLRLVLDGSMDGEHSLKSYNLFVDI